MTSVIDRVKRVERRLLSLARMTWFRKLALIFIACVAMSLAANAIPIPYGKIVYEAECLVLPVVRGAADALREMPFGFSNDQNRRQVMNYHCALSTLLILGILLEAMLAAMHIHELFRGRLKKHPVVLKSMVTAGALLIAVGAIPELGGLLEGAMTT